MKGAMGDSPKLFIPNPAGEKEGWAMFAEFDGSTTLGQVSEFISGQNVGFAPAGWTRVGAFVEVRMHLPVRDMGGAADIAESAQAAGPTYERGPGYTMPTLGK